MAKRSLFLKKQVDILDFGSKNRTVISSLIMSLGYRMFSLHIKKNIFVLMLKENGVIKSKNQLIFF